MADTAARIEEQRKRASKLYGNNEFGLILFLSHYVGYTMSQVRSDTADMMQKYLDEVEARQGGDTVTLPHSMTEAQRKIVEDKRQGGAAEIQDSLLC